MKETGGIPSRRPCGKGWLLGLCLLAGLGLLDSQALGLEVSEQQQVPIFFKLLTYDRTLDSSTEDEIRIGILVKVRNGESEANGREFSAILDNMAGKTINGRPFTHVMVPWSASDDLKSELEAADLDVVYVTAGHGGHLELFRDASRDLDILSLGAESDYVGRAVSIGLGLRDNRPRILVNLDVLHREGHDLDARILRLCKVVSEE